jgi:pimeloyl-ACP methyl ester carboxylesterase
VAAARVTSADGTAIAFERAGAGPAVILVGGGLDDGAENAPLMPALAARFTVVNYARRGRGESGDGAAYAVEREVEDIAALIAEVGGPVHLFGASSGGALALEAAGLDVARIAVYEAPYPVEMVDAWLAYREQLAAALAEDRRGEALELFMRLAGSSDEAIAGARAAPAWPQLEALAPTLAYDAACLRDGRPPERFAAIEQPVLVLTGADPGGFFGPAADALVATLPRAERRVLAGEGHVAAPGVLADALAEFFSA